MAPRFGKYQWFTSKDLQSLGRLGKIYSSLIGYTQIGGYGRSLWFRKIIQKENISFKNALDAGCGCGEYAFYLAEKFPGSFIMGIDYDQENIDKCQKIKQMSGLTNVAFKRLDLRDWDVTEEYDFIYSIDVLEHIKENKEVLNRFYNALQPDGFLYIRIPTPIQKRIFSEKYFESHKLWAREEHVGQHYDLPNLKHDLENIGFTIIFSSYTNGFWGRLAFELDHLLRNKSRVLAAFCLPVLKFFFHIDLLTSSNKKEGNGIVILARK